VNVAGRLETFCLTDGPTHVLVLRREDIRWLTGFTGGTSQLVVNRDTKEGVLIVDGRYFSRAQQEVLHSGASIEVVRTDSTHTLLSILSSRHVEVLATHPGHITAEFARSLNETMALVDEHDHLGELRRVKNAQEIELMQRAAEIADSALLSVVADGLSGKTEKQVRNRLEYLMREVGADRPGFDTIVATGPHGASAHHEPTDAVIEGGHGVVIDMGAEVEGYRSDMTRTVLVGNVSTQYRQMWDLVHEAQASAVQTVRDGVVGSEVDAAARAVFARAGLEHEFIHGTGHGIGLYIHEMPILSPRCTAVLRTDEVVTVEPGLYRGGVGGVRIEDQVVVTDTNCRILTLSPKELSCPQSPQMI
jgi:Xaa-Pro aminopeptidase